MCTSSDKTKLQIEENGFEFLKLDYEQGMLAVKQCHDQKLSYQKFYIAIVSAIVIVSVFIQRIMNIGGSATNEAGADTSFIDQIVQVDGLIGITFVFAGVIGYTVVKNLAHIRINAVFYSNAVVDIRHMIIKVLELKEYPDLQFSRSNDRKSADYVTIMLCSLTNLVLINVGVILIMGDEALRQVLFDISVTSVLYVFFHFVGVERTLARGIKTQWNAGS